MGLGQYLFGKEAEGQAQAFLISHGFLIVERNFRCKMGEVDIIASKDGVLHFVEVKASKKYEPAYNINHQKLAKLFNTIDYYLQKNCLDMPYQLDALIVKGNSFELIQNITIM